MPPSVAAAVKREIDTRANGKPKEKIICYLSSDYPRTWFCAVENTKGSRKGKNI